MTPPPSVTSVAPSVEADSLLKRVEGHVSRRPSRPIPADVLVPEVRSTTNITLTTRTMHHFFVGITDASKRGRKDALPFVRTRNQKTRTVAGSGGEWLPHQSCPPFRSRQGDQLPVSDRHWLRRLRVPAQNDPKPHKSNNHDFYAAICITILYYFYTDVVNITSMYIFLKYYFYIIKLF